MKDGSGNPTCSEAKYSDYLMLFQRCSVSLNEQPDAAVTQGKLGHAKKIPLEMSKGCYILWVKEHYSFSSSSFSSFSTASL
jgi:hypothetical protein